MAAPEQLVFEGKECIVTPSQSESFGKSPARIEMLRVQNYRALKDITLQGMTPLTVLVGPNGSGKSTVFDVFNFLSECFQHNLRSAWDRRGRAKELKTRNQSGPVVIEIKYREAPSSRLITYHLAIDENNGNVFVRDEWLAWKRGIHGQPFRFLDYHNGQGKVIAGDEPDESATRVELPLRSNEYLAVNTIGQLSGHPRVAALREFIEGWHVSYLAIDDARGQPEAGPQEQLSKTGDNLANVIQYLFERHPDVIDMICTKLRERIPQIETIIPKPLDDGRLLLQIKDAPFEQPVLSRFASDGTIKMLAYLVLLYCPKQSPFIGVEEPENYLHHRLLPILAEECQTASEKGQVLVTTHSPFFLNALHPEQVRILERNAEGFTVATRASQIRGVKEFMEEGDCLGSLWTEGRLMVGDPLKSPSQKARRGGK